MFSRRLFVALAVALMMGSSAFAGGGGGTKKDATITVRNDTLLPIAAFIDITPAQTAALAAIVGGPTQTQIEAQGGKLINPGASASFAVRAGTYTLSAGSGFTAATSTAAAVTIGKGQTKRFAYTQFNTLAGF